MNPLKFILFGMVCLLGVSPGSSQSLVIPAEVKPFLEPGYDWMDIVKGDLNKDGKPDYVAVMRKSGEDTIGFDNPEWDAGRPLILLIRQPDGKLKMQTGNRQLVLCRNCGGAFGDPYEGIVVKPGEFSISFYGGSSWRWEDEYLFRFDPLKKDWFLETHRAASFNAGDPEKTMTGSIIKRKEIGDLPLHRFSGNYNYDSSIWRVKSAKAYFYTSPDLLTKPRKSYLVQGDTVMSVKQFRNFIECSFSNANGDITTGYIPRKDLLLITPYTPRNSR